MTNSLGSSTLILRQNLFFKSLSVKLSSMLGWRSLKAMKDSISKSKKEALNKRKRRCLCRLKDLKKAEVAKMMKSIEGIYKQGLTLQLQPTERNSKLPDNTRSSSLGSSRVIAWTHSQIWAAWETDENTLWRKISILSSRNKLSLIFRASTNKKQTLVKYLSKH